MSVDGTARTSARPWRGRVGIAGLAACSPEMQARSAPSAPIGSLDDWHFGGQSMQPVPVDQHSLGATGPRSRRGDMSAREWAAPADFAVASLYAKDKKLPAE